MKKHIRLDIAWHKIQDPIDIPHAKHIELCILPETIPIIFIPGIMGSKLKCTQTDSCVWDPDNAYMMLFRYYSPFSNTQHKVDLLIGPQGHHPEYLVPIQEQLRFHPQRSWQQISATHYQKLHHFLQHLPKSPLCKTCFEIPAFAFAYNWTNSIQENAKKLHDYVQDIIQFYQHIGFCQNVFLVTHSMGGLIARTACRNRVFQKQVMGMILVAEPQHGAPSLYHRMKCGFERPDVHLLQDQLYQETSIHLPKYVLANITAACLGKNGQEVTALIGNMPGALAMLPSTAYRNTPEPAAWLFTTPQKTSGTLTAITPQNCYQQIYLTAGKPWSLLDPRDLFLQLPSKIAWKKYCRAMEAAEAMHAQNRAHSMPAHHAIVGVGHPTVARINVLSYTRRPVHKFFTTAYTWTQKQQLTWLTQAAHAQPLRQQHPARKKWHTPHIVAGYANGDGTVVPSDLNAAHTTCVEGLSHDLAMCDPHVHHIIASKIQHWLQHKLQTTLRGSDDLRAQQ